MPARYWSKIAADAAAPMGNAPMISSPMPSGSGAIALGRSPSWHFSPRPNAVHSAGLQQSSAACSVLDGAFEVTRRAIDVAVHALEHAALRHQRIEAAHARLQRMEDRIGTAIAAVVGGTGKRHRTRAGERAHHRVAARGEPVEELARGGLRARGQVGVGKGAAGRRTSGERHHRGLGHQRAIVLAELAHGQRPLRRQRPGRLVPHGPRLRGPVRKLGGRGRRHAGAVAHHDHELAERLVGLRVDRRRGNERAQRQRDPKTRGPQTGA